MFVGQLVPTEIAVNHMDDEQIWQQLELMVKFIFEIAFVTTYRYCFDRIISCCLNRWQTRPGYSLERMRSL